MAQSLDRGLRILDEIAAGRTTLGEIAESLGVHKSTALRLLATLAQHHFVYREDASNYRLGRRLFDLAAFALDSRHVASVARAPMRRLVQRTGHSTYLATLEGREVVVLEIEPGQGSLRTVLRVGEALPALVTASGKVLLSGLPDGEVEAFAARDGEAAGSRDHDEVEGARGDVARARTTGVAYESGEYLAHVSAVAAPIRSSAGDVVAALALMVPTSDAAEHELERALPDVLSVAGEISTELGWT